MSAQLAAGDDSSNVVPLRRPPIRRTTLVHADRESTFDVFVHRLAEWWPLTPFSFGGDRVQAVLVDGVVGGEVVEVWDDGSRESWGEVLEWSPPETFAMTWNITGTATIVALRFEELAAGVTRVELEHRGWENLTEDELTRDCAIEGGYDGGSFDRGWEIILGRLTAWFDNEAQTSGEPSHPESS